MLTTTLDLLCLTILVYTTLPIAARRSSTLVGIVRMSFCIYSTSMFCRTTWIFSHKSSLHVGEVSDNLKRLSTSFHKCSMEFKSRDCGGHSNTEKSRLPNHRCTRPYVCFGSLSCWKITCVSSRFSLPMVSSNCESKISR